MEEKEGKREGMEKIEKESGKGGSKMDVFDECERYRGIIYNICDSIGVNRDINVNGNENGIGGSRE